MTADELDTTEWVAAIRDRYLATPDHSTAGSRDPAPVVECPQ